MIYRCQKPGGPRNTDPDSRVTNFEGPWDPGRSRLLESMVHVSQGGPVGVEVHQTK